MDSKHYTEVLIDGNIYTLGGVEEEAYLQKVASYINDKIATMRKQAGFTRQSSDYQIVMTYLNLADDLFKEKDRAGILEAQRAEMEKETYSLKHELVTTQMKLEGALKELERLQAKRLQIHSDDIKSGDVQKGAARKRPAPKEDIPKQADAQETAVASFSSTAEEIQAAEEEKRIKEELERQKAVQAAKASASRHKSRTHSGKTSGTV